jgi:AraC-type DNA-binding domain-containing proteins
MEMKVDERKEAVHRMQNYIAEHLCDEITLADLAKASCYSPWHSYRLFERLLGVTPADYIRKMRLSKSALRLRNECVKITDVAFEVGFNSVDGYQRAFYREFGCNPREYANNPVPIYLFTPYDVKYASPKKEYNMEKVKNVFIQVVEKPARKVLIKRGVKASDYFSYCEEVGCDIWGLLVSMSGGSEPVSMWLPKKYIKPNTSEYVQGVEVELEFSGVVPESFDVIEMPAAKFLKFQGEPFEEADYCDAIKEIWEAEKKFKPETIGYSWDTENPRIQLEPRGERGYIEFLPIK